MPKCSQCGAEALADQSVCPQCGAPVSLTESFSPVEVDETSGELRPDTLEGPVLIVRKGPQLGERFYLDGTRYSVGRDPGSDIFLNDMTVSRNHATLEKRTGRFVVRDANSLNGTYVNGVCVDNAVLAEGDVLQIGTFQMVYHGEDES